jgi:phage-related baseplate assembly protein
MIEALKNAPALSFIDDRTVDELLEEMVGDYESFMTAAAGTPQKLSRASPARMVLAAAAAQIYGALQLIDRAGKQNLLQYSYGGFLDNLALFKGVTRKPASPASVLLRFTLSAARDAATGIPQGTRVSTVDGVYFAADQYAEIPAGSLTVDVRATCTLPGAGYNGIPAGAVGAIVDPVPYVASAVSISASSGGADIEDDEALVERIYNAPSGYSTAGPEAGYLYHAKQFSAAVGDVAVSSVQAAGRVDVVFVMADGSTPDSAAIAGLTAYLNDKSVRPMTDLVKVAAPTEVSYAIALSYTINRSDSARAAAIQATVSAAVEEYIRWQRKIGRDINPSQLIMMVMAAGAKRVTVTAPSYQTVGAASIAALSGTTAVTYGGLEDD